MLEQLTIKNVAVIERLDVTFKNGLTVLTGETGAGKSIIIDSINMILGGRANKDIIRNGSQKAEVQAVFGMDKNVRTLLNDNDIDVDDDSVIVSRRITREGKSTARVNGTVVTLNMLRVIADMLINIHGQHDNQALLNPSKHILFLDYYAHLSTEIEEYRLLYNRLRDIEKNLNYYKKDEQEKLQRMEFLSYQINEIEAANLISGEEEDLTEQKSLLENAEQISICSQKAYAYLYEYPDGQSAYDMISTAIDAVSSISELNTELSEMYESLNSAMYAVADAAKEIRDFGNGIEFDEQSLNETEERLDLIRRLKRKYGGSIQDILDFEKKAQSELDDIVMSDEKVRNLEEEYKIIYEKVKRAGHQLTQKRLKSAKALEIEIQKSLHELNMEKAVFSVTVSPQKMTSDGFDDVEFMIATNPGEDLKPLVKIASGGELSRVMLAIKSILAKSDDVGTLIFDEIDTGVSGSAAQKIADKLCTIAETKQVICITHLPQLASAADNHFVIVKNVDEDIARTSLKELDTNGRVKELARIVGSGEAAEAYAREMLKYKN